MKSEPELNALRGELAVLNAEFFAAMAKRKTWMDAHMEDFARFKVGDEIFEIHSGKRLGVISKLYRYWGSNHRDPQYDTTMNIAYEYHTGNNCFDNTSRRPISIGTAQDLRDNAVWKDSVATWSECFGDKMTESGGKEQPNSRDPKQC